MSFQVPSHESYSMILPFGCWGMLLPPPTSAGMGGISQLRVLGAVLSLPAWHWGSPSCFPEVMPCSPQPALALGLRHAATSAASHKGPSGHLSCRNWPFLGFLAGVRVGHCGEGTPPWQKGERKG